MPKIDLRKELGRAYMASRKPEIIDVPPGRFLTHAGRGEPGAMSIRRGSAPSMDSATH